MKKLYSFLLGIVVVILVLAGLSARLEAKTNPKDSDKLVIYNWGDYIDPELLKEFTKETGVQVQYNTFDSNEAMYTKIKQGGTAYDIAIPSEYMIAKMMDENLLEKLDKSKLKGLDNIDPRFLDLDFDPDNQYSVPYFWGTLGIIYNSKMVDKAPEHWEDLWRPEYKNDIMMYDGAREVNGSSGECIYQSVADRKLVLEEVMAVAKGKLTIIAHVACNNTKDSVELARHAEELGVDAIAAIPPIYFRLPEYSVAHYWNEISAAAPNTDFVIYNIPQLAGVALTPSLYKEMLKNQRVIGVKNSSMPVQDIQTFASLGGEDHIVFNGPDEQFLGGRLMGAGAGIGGTYGAMPELFLKLNQLIADKDLETARALQFAINGIIGVLTSAHGNMYGVIKEVLRINEGLELGSVRSPLTPLTEADQEVVQKAASLIREVKERFL